MGKTQDTVEATPVMERNLNQAFLDLHSLGSACADSHSMTSRSPFLDKEVKASRRWVSPLTNLHRLAGSQAALGEDLLRRLILKHG